MHMIHVYIYIYVYVYVYVYFYVYVYVYVYVYKMFSTSQSICISFDITWIRGVLTWDPHGLPFRCQGNSEHSRHWFFGGKVVIDGEAGGCKKARWCFQL